MNVRLQTADTLYPVEAAAGIDFVDCAFHCVPWFVRVQQDLFIYVESKLCTT